MNMDAEITIVIPVYNRAHIVGRTLESVAHQTLRPLDVILVDNNSSDNSYEVLQAWKQANEAPDFRVTVLSETKQGACAARNRGLAEVTTPYVMFFDSDDVMLPCHAESFVDAFRQDRTLDIVGRNITISFLNGAKSTKKFRGTLYHHIFHSSFSTQKYAIRTELVRSIGAWNTRLLGWNDYELGLRILTTASPRVKALKGVSVITYQQKDSITGTDFSSKHSVWESALDECENLIRNASLPIRYIRYINLRRVILAGHYRKEGSSHAKRIIDEVLTKEHNCIRRLFYRFAYRYVASGGRGIALLAPLVLR